jgi:hypothetical protein
MQTITTEARIARALAAYHAAFAVELKLVDALPERPSQAQIDRAWRAAEKTNRALRALQALRDRLPSP